MIYPDHSLSDNAQYWIGECYYAEELYREAAIAFRRVLVVFQKSNKHPDAFFKLGLCYFRQDQMEKAAEHWNRLRQLYPESRAAGLARKYLARIPA